MKHKLIKTDNYLLIVSDERIEDLRPLKDRWHLEQGSILNKFPTYLTDLTECKLVLAHLPLNNSPILEGVPLLPPLEVEDDVEKLAIDYANTFVGEDDGTTEQDFKAGYNKAKEKYKFTEEDVLVAIEIGFEIGKNFNDDEPNVGLGWLVYQKDNYIQSLSQPKTPTHFEFEMEQLNNKPGSSYEMETRYKPKTTTNSQGQTQVVGRYIYE